MARRKSVFAEPAVSETAGEQNGNTTIENNAEENPVKVGTTSALFGEESISQPAAPVEQPAVPEEKKEIVQQSGKTQDQPQTEELYLEDILAKQGVPLDKVKSRIKVDGKEEVVSFEEFRKRVQLKEHLDRAGQELGRQRREFLEMRKGTEKERPQISQVPERSDLEQQNVPSYSDPTIEELKREIESLKAYTAGLNPVIFNINRQKVSNDLKAEGFEDFLDYIPTMEVELSKVTDPALQAFYDTEEGSKVFYKQLKAKEFLDASKKKSEEPQKSAPMERPRPPVQRIDGGNQPSSMNANDDWNAKYNELLTKWKRTKDRGTFQELLKHQNSLVF